MKILSKLPCPIKKTKKEIVQLRGINYSDNFRDGDLAESGGVSFARYPYLSEMSGVVKWGDERCTAVSSWNDDYILVYGNNIRIIDNTGHSKKLYENAVTEGAKQFAVMNTKLVIWPDKKYIDLNTWVLDDLGHTVELSEEVVFGTNTISIDTHAIDFRNEFSVGDGITISGCPEGSPNNKTIVITEIEMNVIHTTDNALTAETCGTVTLSRVIPDMDYICESENRLWGCSSADKKIYASALGDPTNFNVYQNRATDSFSVPVGSDGDFTGCSAYSSAVLFWKEKKLHKVLGSYPAEYSLYSYDIEGVAAGCRESLQTINEVLYYMSPHGVCAYTGGSPKKISAAFGNKVFTDAAAGTDGVSYFLSAKDEDGAYHLFEYDTRYGMWLRLAGVGVTQFVWAQSMLSFIANSGIFYRYVNESDPNGLWYAQFKPFYETIEGRKTYSKILLRVELPEGSYIRAEIRQDGGAWRRAGEIAGGRRDVVPMRLPVGRCDKFEIKLSGKGPFAILSMLREYSVGSEV